MRLSLVVHVCGLLIRVFGLMFLAPLALALVYREFNDALGFTVSAAITVRSGN